MEHLYKKLIKKGDKIYKQEISGPYTVCLFIQIMLLKILNYKNKAGELYAVERSNNYFLYNL